MRVRIIHPTLHRLIQLAKSNGAIVVSPDYRLIPEAKGVDILEDIKDFWSWVHRSMPSAIQKVAPCGTKVDLDKVAVAGESAGGYLSLLSAFLFPEARIKLVMAQYAALDVDHPAYNPAPYTVPPEGSFVDKYILGLKPGAIRLSSPFPEDWDLCLAILQEGRYRDLIGKAMMSVS
jgi:acetyl esterase/lipase